MLNQFEFVTSSSNKSFDSSMNSKRGTSAHCSVLFIETIRKRLVLRNMELSESRKNDNFGKSSKFPEIPAGNFRDRRFLGIPISWEFLNGNSRSPWLTTVAFDLRRHSHSSGVDHRLITGYQQMVSGYEKKRV